MRGDYLTIRSFNNCFVASKDGCAPDSGHILYILLYSISDKYLCISGNSEQKTIHKWNVNEFLLACQSNNEYSSSSIIFTHCFTVSKM